MSADMVREVMVPLMSMTNFTLLAIATPDGSMSNHYTRLMDLTTETGAPLFKTIRIALCCPTCVSKYKNDVACPHRADLVPPWKSTTRLKLVSMILADDAELNARENMGLLIGDHKFFLSRELVDTFDRLPREYFPGYSVPFVFIGIDPSGAGSQSTFAMASVALNSDGRYTVSARHRCKNRSHMHHVKCSVVVYVPLVANASRCREDSTTRRLLRRSDTLGALPTIHRRNSRSKHAENTVNTPRSFWSPHHCMNSSDQFTATSTTVFMAHVHCTVRTASNTLRNTDTSMSLMRCMVP